METNMKEVVETAIYHKYGSFSKFAESEFGYKIVKSKGNGNQGVVCPHHTSSANKQGDNCMIDDIKNVFNCFSCGHGGSLFDMTMLEKNMDFKESMEWLAEKAGIILEKNPNAQKTVKEIRRAFAVICYKNLMAIKNPSEDVARYNKLSQYKAEYEGAIQYLAGRGFITKSLKKFEIGYCGVAGVEIEEMFKNGYSVADLLRANIMMESQKTKKKFVPLKGRITLMASENIYGRKVICDEDRYKHYYSRSQQQIWNLNTCQYKERDIVFVVEALFDAIAIQQFIDRLHMNWAVVATCGTGGVKKEELVKTIMATNPKCVMIVPDSDDFLKDGKIHAIGQKKGLEKAYAFESAGQNTRVVVLPIGKDPGDLAKDKCRATEFKEMVKKALYPVRYEIYLEAHFNDRKSTDNKKEFLNSCKRILSNHKITLRSDMIDWITLLIDGNREEVEDFFKNTFSKATVLDYFKTCRAHGMKDEEILKHIQSMLP